MAISEAKNIAASVRQQLLNIAKDTGRPFQELLQYYVIERFLYRLSQSQHVGRFYLKGALMFRAWGVSPYRATIDIDMLAYAPNHLDECVAIFKDICSNSVPDDGVVFDLQTVVAEASQPRAEYRGIRLHFLAYLEKTTIRMQIDLGFGDQVYPGPVSMVYPTILDMPAPELKGYTRESVVAEKLETVVRRGTENSRLKDYFDLWVLSRQFEFEGMELTEATRRTFVQRGISIPETVVGLSPAFSELEEKQLQWKQFIKRSKPEVIPSQLEEVVDRVSRFLAPVVERVRVDSSFNCKWLTSGSWRDHD